MKKKIVIGIMLLFACFALTGCGCSKKEFIVKFDSNGGSSIASQTVEEGKSASKPAVDPTRDGYSFDGWFRNLNDLDAFDFNSKITADITLYAKWSSTGIGGSCSKTCGDGYTLDSSKCECVKNSSSETDVNVPVSKVSLSKKSTTLTVGASESLKLTISPSNASNKSAKWSSSDTSVVTVDKNGKITAVAPGAATVSVTVDGKSTSISVSVKAAVLVDSITISGDNSVNVSKTIKLTATVKPSDATNKTVSWKSSDSSIATVDANGNVKGIKAGVATITASAGGKSATFKVTVVAPAAYTITLTKLVQVGSGTVLQYEISSVTNNGSAASFKNFSYNGATYWSSDKTILAREVKESITTAKITLADGSTVDATVKYASREI